MTSRGNFIAPRIRSIVFNLVDVGILRREADDHVEDFHGVYDFREAFDPRDLATHIGSAQQGN